MLVSIPLLAVHMGPIAELGLDRLPSAIAKHPVEDRIEVTSLGLVGDFQADHVHHGGHDKALHHYPAEHYADWQAELSNRSTLFRPGGFGENLSTLGLRENDICLGDSFRLGTALIQVSQGRQPCSKLDLRFDTPDMRERVFKVGRLPAGQISSSKGLASIKGGISYRQYMHDKKVVYSTLSSRIGIDGRQ